MKKLMLAVSLGAALLLAACGGTASSAPVSSSASQPVSSSASQSASSGMEEQMVEGTITDATMNTLQLTLANGAIYNFATEGAEIEAGSEGIVLGETAAVYYTGTLAEGEEAQTVTVTRVVVQ